MTEPLTASKYVALFIPRAWRRWSHLKTHGAVVIGVKRVEQEVSVC